MSKLWEIHGAFEGVKVRRKVWGEKEWMVVNLTGMMPVSNLIADDWELYEPKRKKTVTLYASIRKTRNMSGDFYYVQGGFNSEKSAPSGECPHVGWAEIEVEIEG
jgi:hypothetical protein